MSFALPLYAPVTPPAPDPIPAFVRRTEHRGSRGTLPSEKHSGGVGHTTAAQHNAMLLLELMHGVVDYSAYPLGVEVRPDWGVGFTYWPAIGLDLLGGRRAVLDIVYADDHDDRQRLGFDAALKAQLDAMGVQSIQMSEPVLRGDPRLRVAREIRRACGTRFTEADVFSLIGYLAEQPGPTPLGHLRRDHDDGDQVVAMACVLGMRRRLVLQLNGASLNACSVSLPRKEAV